MKLLPLLLAIGPLAWLTGCSTDGAPAAVDEKADEPTVKDSAVDVAPVKSPTLNRWAIVADDEVRQSGLSDLLSVELSSLKGVELVERERLTDVVDEQALAGCFTPDGSTKRLRLGELLKADALVFLSIEPRGENQVLRAVVSECNYGARLRAQEYPHAPEMVAELAAQCAAEVAATRAQFSGGVATIVGVSHFISKNLTHDFDHLQPAYATLLSDALNSQPGVAVLEIDEARSITRELARSPDGLADRAVPMFIEGEFAVSPPGAGRGHTVDLRMVVKCGKKSEQAFQLGQQPESEVAAWLSQKAPEILIKRIGQHTFSPVSEDRQVGLLRDRAIRFTRLGAHQHAASLCESALLLDPSNVDVRLAGVRAYDAWGRIGAGYYTGDAPAEQLGHWYRSQVEIFLAGDRHLRFLVRNRRISMEQATDLCTAFIRRPGFSRYSQQAWKEFDKYAVDFERERLQFIREVFLRCRDLPCDGALDAAENRWKDFLFGAVRRSIFSDCRGETRSEIVKLQTELFDDLVRSIGHDAGGLRASAALEVTGLAYEVHQRGAGAREDFLACMRSLVTDSNPLLSLCGRTGLVQLHWFDAGSYKATDTAVLGPLLSDATALQEEYKKQPIYRYGKQTPFDTMVTAMKRHVNPYRSRDNFATRVSPLLSLRPAIATEKKEVVTAELRDLKAKVEAMSGETVDLKRWEWARRRIKTSTGRMTPLTRCGDRLNVALTTTSVLFHRKLGEFVEVHREPDAVYSDCAWDGEFVWVATLNAGIVGLDSEGNERFRIGPDDGLPPADWNMLLWPLREGKVFATGSFGPHRRGWCAIVERKDRRYQIDVIHEATEVVDGARLAIEASRNTQITFVPHYVQEVVGVDPRLGRLLIVSRKPGSRESGVSHTSPLFVRLDGPEVFTGIFRSFYYAHDAPPFFLNEGRFISRSAALATLDFAAGVKYSNAGIDEEALLQALKSPWDEKKQSLVPEHFFGGNDAFIDCERVVDFRGRLYFPKGSHAWVRVNPASLSAESLACNPPLPGRSGRAGCVDVSAHGVLVMRLTDTASVYAVSISDEPEPLGRFAPNHSPIELDKLKPILVDMAAHGSRFDQAALLRLKGEGVTAIWQRLNPDRPFLSSDDGEIPPEAAAGLASRRHIEAFHAYLRGLNHPPSCEALAHLVAGDLAKAPPAGRRETFEYALSAVARPTDERLADLFIPAFRKMDEATAVWFLQQGIQSRFGAKLVFDAVHDPRDTVSVAAIRRSSPFLSQAHGRKYREKLRRALIEQFDRRSDAVRIQVANTLNIHFKDPEAIKYLLKQSHSSDKDRALLAIRSLGNTMNSRIVAYPELKAALFPLLESPDQDIRIAAAAAASVYTGEDVPAEVMPCLVLGSQYEQTRIRQNLLRCQHPDVLGAALGAAGEYADPQIRSAAAKLFVELEKQQQRNRAAR